MAVSCRLQQRPQFPRHPLDADRTHAARLAKIASRSPCGRQTSSTVSAQRIKQGNPNAAAKCDTPESWPMKPAQV